MPSFDSSPFAADAALAHWREHGWARLGVLADEETLRVLRQRADDIMLGRVVHEGLFFQRDAESGRYEDLEFGRGWEGPSLDYRKIEKLERDPLFRGWLESAVFARLVRAVVGADVAIYRAALFTKGPRGGSDLPWHQDGGSFWGLDRDPELQIWTALDDAPDGGGCLEVLDASHLGCLATPLGGNIPSRVMAEARADERKLLLPARAGEVILLHSYLWHRSGPGVPGRVRRAFTVAYMPATTRCTRRKRAPRTFTRVFG